MIEHSRLPPGENQELYRGLFQDCFPETAGTSLETPEHYRWKYGPGGKQAPPYEFLAREDDQPLGYYVALPFPYQVEGRPTPGGLVCDVMTHSRARGKGIFTKLGGYATDYMAHDGLPFVIGFPIRPPVIPGHLKVGWRIAFPLPVYAKLLDLRPVLASRRAGPLGWLLQPLIAAYIGGGRLTRPRWAGAICKEVEPAAFFASAEFQAFYREWARHYPCHLIRSPEFYAWRLTPPQGSYTAIALYVGSTLAGVAIARNSRLSGFAMTNVVDFMLLPEHREKAGALHDALAQTAKQSGTAGLVIMSTPADAARWNLYRNGFVKTKIVFKLILKWLAAEPAPAAFWDEGAWHLTWLETDNL